jgi:hypothetical protein
MYTAIFVISQYQNDQHYAKLSNVFFFPPPKFYQSVFLPLLIAAENLKVVAMNFDVSHVEF